LTISLTSEEAFNFYAAGFAYIAAITGAALLFWPEKVTAGLLATKIAFAASSVLSALSWAVSAGKGLFMQIGLTVGNEFRLI
jgi:hypothetical protein